MLRDSSDISLYVYKFADTQKSVDTSQSTSSNTDEANRVEVATGTLINLESPVSTSEAMSTSSAAPQPEDQLDSIEASDQWQNSRMQLSTVSNMLVHFFILKDNPYRALYSF